MFLLFAMASGNGIYYPNGRGPRGGGLHPRRMYVNGAKRYKHGQSYMVGSITDFLNHDNSNCKATLKYYNEYTDEFQDEPPTA
jgi:hypothetical protein